MTQHVLPAPPLGSRATRVITWLKQVWKKEPVGLIALFVTILTLLSPLWKTCYTELVGPDLRAAISFQSPPSSNSENEMIVQVENYSDMPAQGLRITLRSLDEEVAQLERTEIVFGTIGSNAISTRESVTFLSQKQGSTTVEIRFEPINSASNVKSYLQLVPITVKDS